MIKKRCLPSSIFCVYVKIEPTFLLLRISAEKKLVEEVRNNDILVVIGETGSGKTTRK
jgi:HrpA-like RNA helicase